MTPSGRVTPIHRLATLPNRPLCGQILFPTFPGQHQFELTQSFKIHLRVKNDPNANNVIIVEGRILDRDPMRYEDAGVTYLYDTSNQLVSREFDLDGPAGATPPQRTFYFYDQGQIVLAFDGNTAADLSHRYLWGPQVDQLLAAETVTSLTSPGEVLWPLADHLGTIRSLAVHDSVTHVTTIANQRTYDAFGNLVHETNAAVDLLFGYTGRFWDEAAELQFNLNRWYDPVTGRWLSEDPIGFQGDPGVSQHP